MRKPMKLICSIIIHRKANVLLINPRHKFINRFVFSVEQVSEKSFVSCLCSL